MEWIYRPVATHCIVCVPLAPFTPADAVISQIPWSIKHNAAVWLLQELLYSLQVDTKAGLNSGRRVEVENECVCVRGGGVIKKWLSHYI